jgi:hypothetical protein
VDEQVFGWQHRGRASVAETSVNTRFVATGAPFLSRRTHITRLRAPLIVVSLQLGDADGPGGGRGDVGPGLLGGCAAKLSRLPRPNQTWTVPYAPPVDGVTDEYVMRDVQARRHGHDHH